MDGTRNSIIIKHLKEHGILYTVIIMVFFAGIFLGSYLVKNLNAQQELELLNYLDLFLKGFKEWNVRPGVVAQHAILNNLRVIFYIWFLGLTVIGVPLVLVIICVRGLVLGFTIGFLVQQKAVQGLLIAFLAVLPPSIITLPALMVGAAFAISFSRWLVKGRSKFDNGSIFKYFIAYCVIMLLVAAVSVAGGFVEAYVSPTFMKLISGMALTNP